MRTRRETGATEDEEVATRGNAERVGSRGGPARSSSDPVPEGEVRVSPGVTRKGVKYRGIVQYVGTRYRGWQIQKNRTTVQGVIRDALTRLAGEPVSLTGASRTDSGVHALGQVVHFVFPPKQTIKDLGTALNALLPDDIRVEQLRVAKKDFHARKHALKKRYEYRIYNGPVLSPFLFRRALHIRSQLNLEAMRDAAADFIGTHDFTGFAASSTESLSRTRTVLVAELTKRGALITFRIEADGFLHHMIRNMVGTLLEIGRGKRPVSDVRRILEAKDRRQAGRTAPPDGLFLVKIWY